jgi:hypothetical protein
MALNILLDLGDELKVGEDIIIRYVKKLGRKAGISISAPLEIKISKIKKVPIIVRKADNGNETNNNR